MKAKLHELLHELIVESNQSEENAIVTEDAEDDYDSILLVNSETANNVNPEDISKLFSTPSMGTTTPLSTKKIVNKSEININGKIYKEVGCMWHVAYLK